MLLDEEEYQEIRAAARRRRMTVAEWVRQGLRKVRAEEPGKTIEERLEVVERAAGYSFPSGDIEQVLADIDRARASGLP